MKYAKKVITGSNTNCTLNYSKIDYGILQDSNSNQVETVIAHHIIVDGEVKMISKCINRGN